ncbi:UNVERIFIED_CONTAM: putative tatC-like protein ymf16 [Sesamum indicum]
MIKLQPKIYDHIMTVRISFIPSVCSQVPVIVIRSLEPRGLSVETSTNNRRFFMVFPLLTAALSTPPDIWCQIVAQVREEGWTSGMRESGSIDKKEEKANCLLAGSCMSVNVHVRLREKGGGQKWPCCTSLSSLMESALFFLGDYANMILMRCGALHLTFVGLPFSGACVPAFLCNKPLRPKTSGRWSRGAFGKG